MNLDVLALESYGFSSRVKVCVVVGYGKERERFCNNLERIVDRVGNGFRLCVLGDLNGWVGDRVRVGITCTFRVPGEMAGKE